MVNSFTQGLCHINLGALQRNFRRCGDASLLMPVIKADAYGHGLLQAAHALSDCGARRFAIGMVDEGAFLRHYGYRQDIVSLMPPTSMDEWKKASAENIAPVVCTFDDLAKARTCGSRENPFDVAIKIETGMHRLGFREEQIPSLVETLKAAPEIRPAYVVSHFAVSDVPEEADYTKMQYDTFTRMSSALKEAFPAIQRSLQNSAGTIVFRDAPFEVRRPGITLYGGNPFYGTSKADLGSDFEWVMSLSTKILQITELRKGGTVSYGRTFTAPRNMKLAVAGGGYATGVPRLLSNRLEALVHGRRVHQVGRVCMSMLMLDVTEIPDVKAGDDAWLLGGTPAPGEKAVTPQDWADMLGTISYEILCLVGSLNPRVYEYK